MRGGGWKIWAVGAAVGTVVVVAVWRGLRTALKAPQTTDRPLRQWVDNTDYDESLACDVLSTLPRPLSRWLARAAFYPTLYWTQLKASFSSSNPWMNDIDHHVILGALPRGRAQQLKAMGVGLVINTCEEWDGNHHIYAQLGIMQVRVEIIDYTAPELPQVEQAVSAMLAFRKEHPDQKIYCHCKAGRGRSATILICYYVALGMSPLEAQRLLIEKRPQVSKRVWKRKVVKDFTRKQLLALEQGGK